ncbi:alpha/beta hydrolase [Streptomyces sp. NPDC002520]
MRSWALNRPLARVCAVAALLAGSTVGALAAPANAVAAPNCQEYSVPVVMAGQDLVMAGELCTPSQDTSTVMVLVPGASYDSTYWNFPYDPEVYNFRQATNKAGRATFTVDRIGTGRSSKPLSTTVTATDQGTAVHQVIQALRAGQVGGRPFGTVITGGHSLGSGIVTWEAATFHDVDGVLLTGIGHHLVSTHVTRLFTSTVPANLDPRFADYGLDAGYLTTAPGTREELFYAPGDPDPQVVTTDEATKSVFSATESPDNVAAVLLPVSRSIDVPVLLAVGQGDRFFCGPLLGGADCSTSATFAAAEAPYFSSSAQLQTYVLPGFGHDVNLAPNTQLYQQAVLAWLDSF